MVSIEDRVKNLSVRQRMLLLQQLDSQISARTNDKRKNQNMRLVAFYTADHPLDKMDLIANLRSKLPDHMIPTEFVCIDEFPRLPNGKIDVQSLRPPDRAKVPVVQPDDSRAFNEFERQLAGVWEEVLGISPVRKDDNFFEIGGDSILSIQIVAKARRLGIKLAPNQLFEYQTISELARRATSETEAPTKPNESGRIPLLPIQHWFFEEHKNAPEHWNQALLFDLPITIEIDILETSIGHLIRRHESLRTWFSSDADGMEAVVSDMEKNRPLIKLNCAQLDSEEFAAMLRDTSAELQSGLNLTEPNLFRSVFFDRGDISGSKLLLFAHHLLVDTISWQILLADLESIYQNLLAGKAIYLPPKTDSLENWSRRLAEFAEVATFDSEIGYWRDQLADIDKFPVDFERNLPVLVGNVATLELQTDHDVTDQLLMDSMGSADMKTDELLISVLVEALQDWRGVNDVCIGLERHGRDLEIGGRDLTNTVGWLTSYFPVRLKTGENYDPKTEVNIIREQLRAVPHKGFGYGILRYLANKSGLDQKPTVLFNYLGNKRFLESKVLGTAIFYEDGAHSPKSEMYNYLRINSFVEGGRLKTRFSFSEKHFRRESIGELIEHFENGLHRLLSTFANGTKDGYSLSDFPESGLNQRELEKLLDQIK